MIKQLKNRYNDPNKNKRFIVGIDRSKMRLFDADNTDQNLVDDTPVFDKTDINNAEKEKFADFKF
jgi:hypothetical protein